LGEVILPFVEGKRIKKAVESRKDQMTPKEIAKNTEKNTLFFFNQNFRNNDPVAKEELNYLTPVQKLLITKEFLYIPEDKKDEESKTEKE
jgi:5'-3' exonuclease